MKSIIICEGSTDAYLLQNLMKNAFGWRNFKRSSDTRNRFNVDCEKSGNIATISVAGDSTRITETLSVSLAHNLISTESEQYRKMVLVTDNDDAETKKQCRFTNVFKIGRAVSTLISQGEIHESLNRR